MINRDYEVAKRCDLIFQDDFQGYIDSLEYTGEHFTREEWGKIMKEEDGSGDELTDEEIEGLLDWLEEDGFVKNGDTLA